MGAHALGAAAYGVKGVSLAEPNRPEALEEEIRWQLDHMSTRVRALSEPSPLLARIRQALLGPGLSLQGSSAPVVHHDH